MPDIWELVSTLVKFLLCLGVLGSTGLILVRIVFACETRRLHATTVRQATAFAVLALLAAGAGFALKGAAMTGALSGMTDPEMLGLLWQTPLGTALAYRVAGLGLVLLGLWLAGIGLPIAAGGGLVVLWSFSRVGHVMDVGALWLEILLLLHLAGAAFWIGVLLPLRALAGDRENLSLAAGLGHRFGRIAAVTVHDTGRCQAEPGHPLRVRQSRQMAPALPCPGAPGVRHDDMGGGRMKAVLPALVLLWPTLALKPLKLCKAAIGNLPGFRSESG